MGKTKTAVCMLAAAAIASTIFASNAEADSNLQGLYIGAQGGYGLAKADILFTDPNDTLTLDGIGAEGPVGGLFLGYGRDFARKWHAGIELEGSLSNIEVEATANDDRASAEIDRTFGVTARLGYYLIDNGMLFARLGWVRSRFDSELNTTRDTEWKNGIRFGGGLQFDLSKNLFFRGEYVATNYDDFVFVSGNDRLEIDPWSHIFRLGLAYRF